MTPLLRTVSANPPGTATSRLIKALGLAEGPGDREALAAEWRDSPQVLRAFELRTKADVPAGGIGSAWGSALALSGIAGEILEILRGQSIVEQLLSRMRRAPFQLRVPREATTGTSGDWTGEGVGKPVVSFAFDFVQLPPTKVATLTILSQELLRTTDSVTEAMLRQIAIGNLAQLTDTKFLDPAAAADFDRPSSVTNGQTAVTSTGTTAAQITADLGAMLAAITTAGRSLVWIMKPRTGARIALALGLPAIQRDGLFGAPVILNANSPQQIALIDASEVVIAASDPEVDRAREATVEMLDAPTGVSTNTGSPPSGPIGTSLVSLWQANSIGVKAERFINWVSTAGSVSYMTTSY